VLLLRASHCLRNKSIDGVPRWVGTKSQEYRAALMTTTVTPKATMLESSKRLALLTHGRCSSNDLALPLPPPTL